MMTFLRSQSQLVLVLVLGFLGLGFLFYGSGNLLNAPGSHGSTDYGRIGGEDLSIADLMDGIREERDSMILSGQDQQLNQPSLIAERAWARLLLLHEADRLHIQVSDKELVDYIHAQPLFQKDGVYSPEVYESQMVELKNVLHVPADAGGDATAAAKAVFENVVRNDLRVAAVRKALFSSIRTPATDVAAQYEKYYGPATVSLVTFDPKTFVATAQVTPEELAAEYKAHPENPAYRTKEQRKVDYVLFLLSPDQMKLPDPQKAAAKDALGQKALDFALAFQPDPSATPGSVPPPPPDFIAEAKKRGLSPATTDFFTADTPPANVPPSPAFNNSAFALSKDDPISKVIEMDNGVAVLHLAEIKPSDLRPLSEVSADMTKQLQQAKGAKAEQIAAGTAAENLKAAMAKGVDFKLAAALLGLKVETLPPFVPIQAPQTDQRLQTIAYVSTTLEPGQVSEPTPVQANDTTVILHLDARAKADPAGLAQFEARFRNGEDGRLQGMFYADWATWEDNTPGTHKPPDLDAYGGAE